MLDAPISEAAAMIQPMSPAQLKIKPVLHDLFEAKEEALKSYYFCQNLGAFAGDTPNTLTDEVGYLQFVLNRNALLSIMKMFDVRNQNYVQLTIEAVIEALPNHISDFDGRKYASHFLKLRKPNAKKIKSRLYAWLRRIRKRPYYKSMAFVRNKVLAHSQDFQGATIGTIRGRNMLRLLKDAAWFLTAVESVVFNTALVQPKPPNHYGMVLVSQLRAHSHRPS